MNILILSSHILPRPTIILQPSALYDDILQFYTVINTVKSWDPTK